MKPNFININGHITDADLAQVSHDNRAFRYGYGLFETMLVQDGQIPYAKLHWQRLFKGMEQLFFTLPPHFTTEYLAEEIMRTVKKNKCEKLCRVRLQVFAGSGGLYDGKSQLPEFLIDCFELQPHVLKLNENGLEVGIATEVVKNNDSLSNLKTSNALVYVIAAQQAKHRKWNDALICNAANNIAESTISNIFWIKNEKVYTPPLSDGCVAGVMRQFIINKLAAQKTIVIEKSLSVDELGKADEVFLTNAIRRLKWVKSATNADFDHDFTRHLYFEIFK